MPGSIDVLPAPAMGRRVSAAAGTSPYGRGLRYAPGLDGIRAIAVAGVLLYHARVSWLPGGFLGVDVFFVLSGYLITSLLLAEHRRTGALDLLGFWRARARRLLPAAMTVIVVCVVVVAAFFPADLGKLRIDALASIFYVNNWHQILASHSYFASFGRPSLLQHYWSLSLEEQFYLVWPLILAAGLALKRRSWIVLAAFGVAAGSVALMATLYHPGADPSRVYYGTDTRAAALMIGALLAFGVPMGSMSAHVGRGARWLLDALGAAGLGAVIFAMVSWHDFDPSLYRGGFVIAAVAAAALIGVAAHPAGGLSRLLGIRPLRWLGQRSYGIYLWHWPVMALSRPGIDVNWRPWLLIPAQVALALVLAELSYRYVEMPVRRGQAQRRVRAWLDARAPRQRLIAVGQTAALCAVALTVLALLPGGSSSPVPPWLASARASAPIAAAATAKPAARPRPTGHTAAPSPPRQSRDPAAPARTSAPVQSLPTVTRGGVLAVGASVMLAAQPQLAQRLHARVDAAVGRQPGAIIDRLAAYREAGALPAVVIVQIGDNGPVWSADITRLRRVLAGVPHVVLVNVREPASWEQEVDSELEQAVATWPQATIADWHAASANPSLLYDGAHPNPTGTAVYASVIAGALTR